MTMKLSHSASVVIPSYNMAWCIARAIKSCQAQSFPVSEIIIVDDCSTDSTEIVVRELMNGDGRIKYVRHSKNQGHLFALSSGVRHTTSDWVALLDADDELTPTSVESRTRAASRYRERTGITPQLVYGDHICEPSGTVSRFAKLQGDAYPFVCKELCLCQTSTIMLGRESLQSFPVSVNPFNTDDIIVLAISKTYPILHCEQVVAVYHKHDGETRMSNNPRKRFVGVYELVRDHRGEVLRTHGVGRLLLWYLRILKAFCDYQIALANELLVASEVTKASRVGQLALRGYRKCLWHARKSMRAYLEKHFELDYF